MHEEEEEEGGGVSQQITFSIRSCRGITRWHENSSTHLLCQALALRAVWRQSQQQCGMDTCASLWGVFSQVSDPHCGVSK